MFVSLLSNEQCISPQFPCVSSVGSGFGSIRLIGFAVLVGTGTSNNYAYLVADEKSKNAVIIDPANPPEYSTLFVVV